jgi:hypothetical protein
LRISVGSKTGMFFSGFFYPDNGFACLSRSLERPSPATAE